MVKEAERRKEKFEAKIDSETLKRQTDALKPSMVSQESEYFSKIADVETKVKNLVESVGTDTLKIRDYLNFAREMYRLTKKFSGATLNAEAQLKVDKWTTKGLDNALLIRVSNLFGVSPSALPPQPSIQDIEDKLDDASHGLEALKAEIDVNETKIDEVEAKLDDATHGLEALKNEIDANETKIDEVEAKLDRQIHSMVFLSVIDDVIDLPAVATDTDLPNVVISGIPTGATLDKVLVFLLVRAIENTNSGGANAIEGTQNIRIKKSTGTWGVDDVIAIVLTDNMWTVASSTREFGDVIGGDDAHDVKSEVDGNATYNLRFEDANVDLNYLRLNDIQVLIKVWYH